MVFISQLSKTGTALICMFLSVYVTFAACSKSNNEIDTEAKPTVLLTIAGVASAATDTDPASNTIDGDFSTSWTASGTNATLTYDLGRNAAVVGVRIAWHFGQLRRANFSISIGSDPDTFTEVYTGISSGLSESLEEYTFAEVSARYVRISCKGNSMNTSNSILETRIVGAPGETVDVPVVIETPAEPEIPIVEPPVEETPPVEAKYPSDVLPELIKWKITLPVDKKGGDSSKASSLTSRNTEPWELKDNDLKDFAYPPYFELRDEEVVFRGHCAGATTSGTKYPRCELRQRVGGGDNYWSVQQLQTLETDLRVTHLPVVKPELSMVQIHGPENEPLRLQFHATDGLYIVWNEANKDYFKSKVPYTLGQRLHVSVRVQNGDITCTVTNLDLNKSYTRTWTSMDATGYFKVGCYTQSSIFLSEIKSGYQNEPLDAYGEITVSSVKVTETYNKK